MVERLSPVVILKAVAIAQRRMHLLEMRYRWSCAMIMVASFTAPRQLQWMCLHEWLTPLKGSGMMCGTSWSMADASHGKELCMREDDVADWAILQLQKRHEGQFLLRQVHRRKKRLLRALPPEGSRPSSIEAR